MTLEDFIERLTLAADDYERIDAYVSGGKLLRSVICDLEAIAAEDINQPVTLTRAAEISGYSADHIGRLVRQGKLKNVGRRGVPRVISSDLPRRPRSRLVSRAPQPYDADTDARSLRVRR